MHNGDEDQNKHGRRGRHMPCAGPHHKMQRFMEICLLVLLYDQTCHGYALIEQLGAFGFEADELNVSTLYRTLRKMENDGWVKSDWKQSGKGPQRRVYSITALGKQELDSWAEVLERRRARIDKVLTVYEKLVSVHAPKGDYDE